MHRSVLYCAILWYTVHRRRCHTFWCTGGAGYIVPYCTILCTEELPIFLLLHRRNCYTIITVLFCAQEEEPYLSFWCTGGGGGYQSHQSHWRMFCLYQFRTSCFSNVLIDNNHPLGGRMLQNGTKSIMLVSWQLIQWNCSATKKGFWRVSRATFSVVFCLCH